MTLETRDTLLGSFAVLCDGTDCGAEHIGMTQELAIAGAKAAGWTESPGTSVLCPECSSGIGRRGAMAQLKQESQAFQSAKGAPVVDMNAMTLAPSNVLEGEPVSAPVATVQKGKKPFVPFADRVGATIPDVMAKAEEVDPEIERRAAAERRLKEKRATALKEGVKKTQDATRAKMGGVEALLNDFDGMFGNQSDPDKW